MAGEGDVGGGVIGGMTGEGDVGGACGGAGGSGNALAAGPVLPAVAPMSSIAPARTRTAPPDSTATSAGACPAATANESRESSREPETIVAGCAAQSRSRMLRAAMG